MMRKALQGLKPLTLIVDKTSWLPPARKFGDNDLVPVRIGFHEKDLIATAKAAKGRWNPEVRLWFILYGKSGEMRAYNIINRHLILDAFCF